MITNQQSAFLAESNVAVLGTVDGKGRPHAAPVWYLFDDGEIIVSTGRGSQKHRNVERNPEISLTVDRRSLPYFALTVYGTVELGPRLTEEDRLRLAARYIGDDLARRYIDMTKDEDSITLKIRPRKIVEFNGRAGRG
jgi:PPOX class probable F420-dependent enzyme